MKTEAKAPVFSVADHGIVGDMVDVALELVGDPAAAKLGQCG